MISQRDFNDATSRKRNKMVQRLKTRYWLTGKRAGHVRKPGRELPFTLEEFRAWCMAHMGFNATPCHYCPRMIDVLTFEPDHLDPLEFGGSPGLENIVPACSDCNRLKGAIPHDDFIKFEKFIRTELTMMAYGDITKRLKSGGKAVRIQKQLDALQVQLGDRKPPRPALPPPKNKDMFDDF